MAFYRASIGGGGSINGYSVVSQQTSSSRTMTISNKSGKKLLALLFTYSSSAVPYARYDNATITGGTLTKLTNLTVSNNYAAGTLFEVDVTSDTCTISHTAPFVNMVLEATT